VQNVLFQNAAPQQFSLFGANSSAVPPPPAAAMSSFGGAPDGHKNRLFGAPVSRSMAMSKRRGDVEEQEEEENIDYSDEDMGYGLFDGENEPGAKPLVFEEGAWEESGMTTVRSPIYLVALHVYTNAT